MSVSPNLGWRRRNCRLPCLPQTGVPGGCNRGHQGNPSGGLQAARDAMFACFGLVDRGVEGAAPGVGDQVPRLSEGEKV